LLIVIKCFQGCFILSLTLTEALAFDWLSLSSRVKRQDADTPKDAKDAKEKAAAAADGPVDLHSGEFCVDVSTFGEVTFEATPREKCETTFQKNCEEKTDQVRFQYDVFRI